ncbi:MAG TPA: glycosyltransferase family 61 protein [Acetobacteraceae bacterium]|nr:glycosyltransferase family 61 protein [Acetobacteraceae bacterium]
MRDAALVATVMADRVPARALRDHIEALTLDGAPDAAALAASLFESVFYRLPPYADARLPAAAAQAYRQLGREDAARLLDGLAAQMTTPAPPPEEAEADAIVTAGDQGAALLSALERLARTEDWPRSAALFDLVWPCLRPLGTFWVYFRMSAVHAALGRDDAMLLMAACAVQIEPADRCAHEPYRRLLDGFVRAGRRRDAAELALRQRALCPQAPLVPDPQLADLQAAAGPLAAPPPPPAFRLHPVVAASERAPVPWRCYGNGVPNGLRQLLQPMQRDAIHIAELAAAEVLVEANTVAVLSADGTLQTELSVAHGLVPALLPARFAERARAGQPAAEVALETAVLVNDEFPTANLCHFLLDHAPRLLLYRRAGIDLGTVTVIGPKPVTAYQRETLDRAGVRAWQATDAPARIRVGRLFVASTCRHLRHAAHWGSDWAVESVRALFGDLTPRVPRRRLLVSRIDATVRRIVNQDEIAALLAPLGFETIVPGRLPFAEQVAAFRDATHIVGPHGAGLGNILFCAPGAHVLEVFHPHYGTWAYAMASGPLGLDYASLVARDGESDAPDFNDPAWPLPDRNAHSGRDMRLDPAALRRWLADTGVM